VSRCAAILSACFLLATAMPVGVAAKRPARGPVRVSDARGAFSVAVPTGWRADKSGAPNAALLLYGPRYEGFTVNVNILEQDVGTMSLSDYLAMSEKEAPGTVPGFRILSKRWTTVGGIRAGEAVYQAEPPGEHIQCMAISTIRDGVAYALTYTAPRRYYDKHLNGFRDIVKSLTWAKRSAVRPVRVSDTAGKLSVAVPAGWQVDRSGAFNTALLLYGPRYQGFTINVNILEQQVGGMSLADYLAMSEEKAPRAIPGFKILSKGWTTVDGLRAGEVVYQSEPPGEHMQCMAVSTIRDGVAYVLTYTAPRAYYARHVGTFRAVVKSVTWTKRAR
jgi:hypothetical protein